nr:immunoglobulin light chain junction region [Macaca mulatta]
CLQSSYWPLTF